jgi:branched-chain amino acid transport system substrate-binding protein
LTVASGQCPAALGIDPLGYYLGGWGYARMQLLGDAIAGAKTIDDEKLAAYKNGEWVTPRQLEVQYHGIADAANLETWRGMSYQTVLFPADEVTGKAIYPYANALG